MSELARLHLERLRKHRRRHDRDQGIGSMIGAWRDRAESTHERLGQVIDLWITHVPGELVRRTTITSLRRGVLHVDVEGSASLYELDRLLRSGLEQRMRKSFRGTLTRVRLRQAADDESNAKKLGA